VHHCCSAASHCCEMKVLLVHQEAVGNAQQARFGGVHLYMETCEGVV
jgi:hypothetical protein